MKLSRERYVAALIRIQALIKGGLLLSYDDSDEPGNKYTHCNWGMCTRSRDAWPDPIDYMWPDRVEPKYFLDSCLCPLDKRTKHSGNGCFYSCMIFNAKHGKLPTRAAVLALFDTRIKELSC